MVQLLTQRCEQSLALTVAIVVGAVTALFVGMALFTDGVVRATGPAVMGMFGFVGVVVVGWVAYRALRPLGEMVHPLVDWVTDDSTLMWSFALVVVGITGAWLYPMFALFGVAGVLAAAAAVGALAADAVPQHLAMRALGPDGRPSSAASDESG